MLAHVPMFYLMTGDESFLGALKREPDKFWLTMRFGLAGAIGVVIGSWVLAVILPPVPTFVMLFVLILVYAGCLGYLTANLVRSLDRWQVDAAKQHAKLATTRRYVDRSVAEAPLPPPTPQATFQQSYFLLRLTENVKDARRHGTPLSLIALDVTMPNETMSAELADKINFEIAHIAADHARTISVPMSTGETEFMFCLPNVDAKGAKAFLSLLVQGLGRYWCHFGVVSYPEDGSESETLFNRAREACEMSRQGREPEKRSQAVA
jgi:GGDEF domain-containing protein